MELLTLFILSVMLISNEGDSSALKAGWSFFDEGRLKQHVAYLGGDECEGRATGSRGEARAADYLAERMRELDLTPMGEHGSYFQRIPFHGSEPLPQSKLRIFSEGREFQLVLNRDYVLFKTGDSSFIPRPVNLVFVGYGIHAPEFGHDDFEDINLRNSIAVYFSGEPQSQDPSYFDGPEETLHALPETKQRQAAARGALGSIMIPQTRGVVDGDWAHWRHTFAFEHVTLPYNPNTNFNAMISPMAANLLFENVKLTMAETLEAMRKGRHRSFSLRMKASFQGRFKRRSFRSSNVVGMLPGTDPSVEKPYVVLTAHYDHLGIGPAVDGDDIYNGVVDNALGVAGTIEIMRALKNLPVRPKRNILLVLVTGEEHGLLGSRYFCDNSPVSVSDIAAAINVDGMAILDTFREVIGVGAELSTLGETLSRVAAEQGVRHVPMPAAFSGHHAFGRSDQLSFAQVGIPAMLVSDGFDYHSLNRHEGMKRFIEWGQVRYHSPKDDLEQPIHFGAVEQHCKLVAGLLLAVGNDMDIPKWVHKGRYRQARLNERAAK